MSDQPLPLGLAQQKVARPIDPEQLEQMGKQAAALFRNKGIHLTQAVVETVKEARLAPEQVKRVCEFANTAAYLEAFEKSGEVRNVTFDGGPADPGAVFKDLNDGSSPAINQVGSPDYCSPSESYKTASVRTEVLAEAFGVQPGMAKTASVQSDHMTRQNPVEELDDLRIQLEGARDDFMSKLSSSGVIYDDIKRDLCNSATQEMADGASLGDISKAWASCKPAPVFLKEAMSLIVDHMTKHHISQEKIAESFFKTASASVVNPEHPVVEQFVAFTKVARGHRVLQHSIKLLDDQIREVRHCMKGMLT